MKSKISNGYIYVFSLISIIVMITTVAFGIFDQIATKKEKEIPVGEWGYGNGGVWHHEQIWQEQNGVWFYDDIWFDEPQIYRLNYKEVLSLRIETVEIDDRETIEEAMLSYDLLSDRAKLNLFQEKKLLNSLLREIEQKEELALEVSTFRNAHEEALMLDIVSVEITDKFIVQLAIENYGFLSQLAKNELSEEKALLDELIYLIEQEEKAINGVFRFDVIYIE